MKIYIIPKEFKQIKQYGSSATGNKTYLDIGHFEYGEQYDEEKCPVFLWVIDKRGNFEMFKMKYFNESHVEIFGKRTMDNNIAVHGRYVSCKKNTSSFVSDTLGLSSRGIKKWAEEIIKEKFGEIEISWL